MYKKTLNILTSLLFFLLLFQVGWWIGTTSKTVKYHTRNYISLFKRLESRNVESEVIPKLPSRGIAAILPPNELNEMEGEWPKQIGPNFVRSQALPITKSSFVNETLESTLKPVITHMKFNHPYDISRYNKLETLPGTECSTMSDASGAWNPIDTSRMPKKSIEDLLVMWPNFVPATVRTVLTRNMILDGDRSATVQLSESNRNVLENPTVKETNFESYFNEHIAMFDQMNKFPNMDRTLEDWKVEMNNLNFVLNSDKFDESQQEDHLPIWLRAYKRTSPLKEVLEGVCKVRDIEKSILIITIDGEAFLSVLSEILLVKCVKIRIYFHAFKNSLQNLMGPNFDNAYTQEKSTKLLTHALYGLYLCFVKYKYPYVITLEDDIIPFSDFYNYHRSLYKHTINEASPYFAISSYAHGMTHNCRYTASALYSAGLINNIPRGFRGFTEHCKLTDVNHLVMENYYAVWGSGMPLRTFKRLFITWLYLPIKSNHFLGSLLRDLRRHDERMISPCSNRISRIDNVGMNGESWYDQQENPRWWVVAAGMSEKAQQDDYVTNWKYNQREYSVLQ